MRNITALVVHHSASSSKTTTVEKITSWHKQRGFTTIGYHYVILHDGTVKKGRPDSMVGAHVSGKNSNSIGICVAGNFEEENPTEAQAASLRALLVELQKECVGAKVTWHREQAATLCPGKNLIQLLTDWRAVGVI